MTPSVELLRGGSLLAARVPFDARHLVGAIFGTRWNAAMGAWVAPASPFAASALASAFGSGALDAGAAQLAQEFDRILEHSRAVRSGDGLEPLPFESQTSPWRHQLTAVRFAEPMRAALWRMGLGTGKTRAALDLIRLRGHRRALVLAPLAVVPAWRTQAALHAPSVEVVPLNSRSVAARASAATASWQRATEERPVVVVVNYETAWRPAFLAAAERAGLDLIVADEIHKLKSPSGVASRTLGRLARSVPWRLGLTGTMLVHSPMDAYGVFRFLDPAIFGDSFVRFRSRYAVMGGYAGREVKGYQNMEEFAARIAPVTFEVGRDVLDLPEAAHVERTFTLSGRAAQVYRDLKTDLVSELAAGVVTATNALTKLLRLSQVASGHVGLDLLPGPEDDPDAVPERRVEELHRDKEALLADVLEEADDEPVVVFCRFRHDLAQVHRAARSVGASSAELSGSRRELESWQRGGARVLAAQIQSGAEGVDLTRARYCVYYSLDYSLGRYEQSLARVHRPGQTRPVTYIHLIAEGTVDRFVRAALEKRKDVIEAVLDAVRAAGVA